jgi:hypothetical protein
MHMIHDIYLQDRDLITEPHASSPVVQMAKEGDTGTVRVGVAGSLAWGSSFLILPTNCRHTHDAGVLLC